MDLLNSVKKPSIKGGFLAEKSGGFLLLLTLPKNILFYCPKLLHPGHGRWTSVSNGNKK